jgi:hypothetical protein
MMKGLELTIKEENVGDRVPGEVVVCDILAFVCDVAASELCFVSLIKLRSGYLPKRRPVVDEHPGPPIR